MPHSILIIDDEPAILNGLEQMLIRSLPNLEVTICENGMQAYENLRQKDFDVVISDIMMPEMTGIQFLQHMQGKDYIPGVLMISGYDDFHYVRDSMRLGAADYLLKPIQQEELIASVQQLLSTKKTAKRMGVSPEIDEDVLTYLIHQRFDLKDDIKEELNRQGINRETAVLPFVIRSHKDLNMLQSLIRERLTQGRIEIFYSAIKQDILYLLIFESEYEPVLELIAEIQKYSPEHLMQYGSAPAPCCVHELPQLIEACKNQLELSYFDCWLTMPAICKNMEEHLADAAEAVKSQELERLLCALDGYLACVQYHKMEKPFVIKSLSNWLYSLMSEMTGMIRVVSTYKLTEYDYLEQIRSAPALSILRKRLKDIWTVYIKEYENTQYRRTVQMDKVKAFVRNNLTSDCQITEAAELIDVSPNYLSTIFKEYMGITFRDYVRETRIKKAVELIRETNMKLYEISAMVGYQDPGHFSRAFKQVTGYAPQYYLKPQIQNDKIV